MSVFVPQPPPRVSEGGPSKPSLYPSPRSEASAGVTSSKGDDPLKTRSGRQIQMFKIAAEVQKNKPPNEFYRKFSTKITDADISKYGGGTLAPTANGEGSGTAATAAVNFAPQPPPQEPYVFQNGSSSHLPMLSLTESSPQPHNPQRRPQDPSGGSTASSPLTLPNIYQKGLTFAELQQHQNPPHASSPTASPQEGVLGRMEEVASDISSSDADDEGAKSPSSYECSPAESSGAFPTTNSRRSSSRRSEGKMNASKHAAVRILKVMFSINVTNSSRLVQYLQSISPEIIARSLYKRCRDAKRRLDKDDFLEIFKGIVMETGSQSFRTEQASNLHRSSLVSTRRKSSITSLIANESAPFASPPPPLGLVVGPRTPLEGTQRRESNSQASRELLASALRREDTDPLFTLFDDDECGFIYTKAFRDKFFTVALATTADIVARLIRMLFTSMTYFSLETVVSRFELQMIASLLKDIFMKDEDAQATAVKRMAEADRERLAVFEATQQTSYFDVDDDMSVEKGVARKKNSQKKMKQRDDKDPKSREAVEHQYHSLTGNKRTLQRLRNYVHETSEERLARLKKYLAIVEAFPSLLNQTSRGCVTIRELRQMCETSTYTDMMDVQVREKSALFTHRQSMRTIQKPSGDVFRYDEVFLDLARFLTLTAAPSITKLQSRASLVAAAAQFLQSHRGSFVERSDAKPPEDTHDGLFTPDPKEGGKRSHPNSSRPSPQSSFGAAAGRKVSLMLKKKSLTATPQSAVPLLPPIAKGPHAPKPSVQQHTQQPESDEDDRIADPVLAGAVEIDRLKKKASVSFSKGITDASRMFPSPPQPRGIESSGGGTPAETVDLFRRTSAVGIHPEHFREAVGSAFGSLEGEPRPVPNMSKANTNRLEERNKELLNNPPEHGAPTYVSQKGKLVLKTSENPDGKFVCSW